MAVELARRIIDGVWKTGTVIEDAGGGSQPPKLGAYTLDVGTVGAGSYGTASFSFKSAIGGSELLDLTDPTTPTIVEDGLYDFIVWLNQVTGVQAGKTIGIEIDAALNADYGTLFFGQGPSEGVPGLTAGVTAVGKNQMASGDTLQVYVGNGTTGDATFVVVCDIYKSGPMPSPPWT